MMPVALWWIGDVKVRLRTKGSEIRVASTAAVGLCVALVADNTVRVQSLPFPNFGVTV